MFCPQCFGEYREGFTTCASCEVELVENLPEETLRKVAARERSRFAAGLTSLRRRAGELPAGAWLVTVWLGLHAAVAFTVLLQAFKGVAAFVQLDAPVLTAQALQGVVGVGLPVISAVGVFLRKRWARLLCLVSLAIGTAQGALGLVALWFFTRMDQSVMGLEMRFSTLYSWLAWCTSALILDLTCFVLVFRYGLGRGELHKVSEVFE